MGSILVPYGSHTGPLWACFIGMLSRIVSSCKTCHCVLTQYKCYTVHHLEVLREDNLSILIETFCSNNRFLSEPLLPKNIFSHGITVNLSQLNFHNAKFQIVDSPSSQPAKYEGNITFLSTFSQPCFCSTT